MSRAFTAALVAGAFLATSAQAAYIANYNTWNELSDAQKSAYAIGAFDAGQSVWGDDKASEALVRGLSECAVELKLNSVNLREAIDRGYTDVERWGQPPHVVLANQLSKMCKPQILRERTRLGLPPIR